MRYLGSTYRAGSLEGGRAHKKGVRESPHDDSILSDSIMPVIIVYLIHLQTLVYCTRALENFFGWANCWLY